MQEDDLPYNADSPGAEELRKLYAQSLDEAKEALLVWASETHSPTERDPYSKWESSHLLLYWHCKYLEGDNNAILEAVYECAMNDLSMPKWLSVAYIGAYRNVRHFRAKSWDEAFGKPHPKGRQLEAHKRRRELGPRVYNRIRLLREKDENLPLDDGLFESVGKEFGICKTLANEYYYEMVNKMNQQAPYDCLLEGDKV
ncbi:MAG: hypothetical protein AB7E51_14675 [Pseudodesulfovibrio sp.]|uniref:hypothetical protein n=1 Tax=Pseudodesulfovibrio sp. TaxID=2035812 RepID=UPI003D0BAEEC